MDWKRERKAVVFVVGMFLVFYFLPVKATRFQNAVMESMHLAKWYAREHVILCLVPAFFIAGAIGVFVSQASVMKYLGARANKVLAYGVASVSGSVLAVCSCTVVPLFAGIYRMGAGLGPATTFLYSGPAINVLAIILTARILGFELGVARAVGAIVFSVVIGLIMHILFRKEETEKAVLQATMPVPEVARPLWKNATYFALMAAILIFANWANPGNTESFWYQVYSVKWILTSVFSLAFGIILVRWFGMKIWKVGILAAVTVATALWLPQYPVAAFAVAAMGLSIFTATSKDETGDWFSSTWGFARQMLPLLLLGILISGALFGRPGSEGLVPSEWICRSVGGNSIPANLFASIVGAFMYFATLTEVPILQGLIGSGMGKGPALALLLSGPALSLPSMLVIQSVLGTKKTAAYVTLVILISCGTGLLYGALFA